MKGLLAGLGPTILVLCLVSQCWAEEGWLTVNPVVEVRETYRTNILNAEEDPAGEAVTVLSPRLTVTAERERWTLDLALGIEGSLHASRDDLDVTDYQHTLTGSVEVGAITSLWIDAYLTGYHDIRRQIEESGFAGVPLGTRRWKAEPRIDVMLGERATLTTSIGYIDLTNENPDVEDYHGITPSIGVVYTPADSSRTLTLALAGEEWTFAAGDFRKGTIRGTIEEEITPTLVFSLSAGGAFLDLPAGDDDPVAVAEGVVSLVKDGVYLDSELLASWLVDNDDYGNAVAAGTVGATLAGTVREDLGLFASAHYRRTRDVAGEREADTGTLECRAGVAVLLRSRFTVGLSYGFTALDDAVTETRSSDHAVTLTVRAEGRPVEHLDNIALIGTPFGVDNLRREIDGD